MLISYYVFGCTERDLRHQALAFRASLRAAGRQDIAMQQPLDRHTLLADFNLGTNLNTYVMCSSCCALYPWPAVDESHWTPEGRCSSTYSAPPSTCNNPLFHAVEGKAGQEFQKPNLTYSHQPLQSWLARMLARPDIVAHLEDYTGHQFSERAEMADIWDSPEFWTFGDGFVNKYPGALKLMFGLGVDGFNPFHNKEAKQVRLGF